ncbi:hypothetical protein FRC06_007962, partial [Ceratobasidium sp. 370]
MSRGEALSAYEAVAKDNERLEKEVSKLRAELAASDFNRATSEVGPSSSWAQIPDWARPQSQLQPSEKPMKPKRTRQLQNQPPARSTSSDQAPSSASEPRASSSSFELNAPRTRSSGSATADPNRSRTPRHASVFSGSESERGSAAGVPPRPRQEQGVGMSRPPRRSGLRDSGFGADSGTDTTRAANSVTKPSLGTKAKIGTRDKERERGALERGAPGRSQQPQTDPTNTPTQQQDTMSSQLMPLLPALTPSKVRAPRVEVIDLPSTSYIEPSFGIHLSRRGTGQPAESDASTLEPPRSAALGPVRSPGTVSPIGELILPPSVVSCERLETEERPSLLAAPVSMDSCVLLPSSLSQSPSLLSVETAHATPTQLPHSPSPNPAPVSGLVASPAATPALSPPPQPQALGPLQSAPILQPIPSLFQAPSLLSLNSARQPQRSRSSSRTARLSPLPVFDLTGLPAYEAVPGTSSTPAAKIDFGQMPNDPTNPSSPTRRQSDPAPASSPGSPPIMRQRSNSAIPVSQPLRADSTLDAPPSTPPRSTNNTAQFAFITPVLDRTLIAGAEDPPAVGTGNQNSTAAELGTTVPGSISLGNTTAAAAATIAATNPENISNANTTGRRRLLPMFKFISPSPGTPPSTKKRRTNRAMTAPSQFGTMSSAGPGSPMGIASSPLARGRVVRESPLQLVMGAAHAATREGMRIPIMREVGGNMGTIGLVPPLVPSAPLVPLVAQLAPVAGASTEAQAAVRGMQAERELLGRAQQQQQSGPPEQVTAESMAKVLLIEAECLRLRRDSAETAALRQEVMMLRSQLQQNEREGGETGSGIVESVEQDYTTTTSTSQTSVSESVETYSNADADSEDTVPTATEATLPEVHKDRARRKLSEVERRLRNARAELDTKERAVAELKLRL